MDLDRELVGTAQGEFDINHVQKEPVLYELKLVSFWSYCDAINRISSVQIKSNRRSSIEFCCKCFLVILVSIVSDPVCF